MAVVLIDGFDLYNGNGVNLGVGAKWSVAVAAAGSAVTPVSGRLGGQGLQMTGGGSSAQANISKTLPGSYGSFAVGVALQPAGLPSNSGIAPHMVFYEGAGTHVGWRINGSGGIDVYRFTSVNAGTLLGSTANGVVTAGLWSYLETEVVISDTVGRVTIYAGGTQVLNLTNQDTRNGGTSGVANVIQFGYIGGQANSCNFTWDDFYMVDVATKLGERKIETIRASADVAKVWVPLSGTSNFAMVNETVANGDTSYVQGSSVGDTDTYGLGDLGTTPTFVDAVQVCCFAEKTDVATRTIALQVKSGATTSDGQNFNLASAYGKFERLLTTDPNTGAAWTAAAVNALQGGPKVTL